MNFVWAYPSSLSLCKGKVEELSLLIPHSKVNSEIFNTTKVVFIKLSSNFCTVADHSNFQIFFRNWRLFSPSISIGSTFVYFCLRSQIWPIESDYIFLRFSLVVSKYLSNLQSYSARYLISSNPLRFRKNKINYYCQHQFYMYKSFLIETFAYYLFS